MCLFVYIFVAAESPITFVTYTNNAASRILLTFPLFNFIYIIL